MYYCLVDNEPESNNYYLMNLSCLQKVGEYRHWSVRLANWSIRDRLQNWGLTGGHFSTYLRVCYC